jgi:hypothetical protein
MKKYGIWKSFELFNEEEEKKFKEDALECYLDYQDIDIDSEEFNQDDFEDYCVRVNDIYFDDDFGEMGNWKFSPLKNQRVAVVGTLGLWNGPHKIMPKQFENVRDAVCTCLEDYNEIYEDQYGNLHIKAHHHDGTNHFIIKKVTDKGLRCLHFRRVAFGC